MSPDEIKSRFAEMELRLERFLGPVPGRAPIFAGTAAALTSTRDFRPAPNGNPPVKPEAGVTGCTFVAEIHLAFEGQELVVYVQLPGAPDEAISTNALSAAARVAEAAKAAWVEALSDGPAPAKEAADAA